MMKNKLEKISHDGLYWALAILPLIITLLVLPAVPDTVPAHYGLNNQVDRWGSKYELFLMPVLTLVLAPFFRGLFDMSLSGESTHSEAEQKSNQKTVRVANYCLVVLLNLAAYFMLFTSLNKVTNLSGIGYNRIMSAVLCLMFIVIGNYLPKCKQNAFIGIRVKWTLENEEVWYRTHRFGGKVFMIGGLISAICCIFVPESFALLFAVVTVLILSIIVCVYAHNIFYKLKNQN